MENPIQKFRQSSIVFEKPGYLSKKFSEFQIPLNLIFFTKNFKRFLLNNVCKKACSVFFYFV